LAQFTALLQTCSKQQGVIDTLLAGSPISSIVTVPSMRPTLPSSYTNAKYEEISCRTIKPTYDGSEDQLVPFLTRLDLRRQNEGRASATYVKIAEKQYDLTLHFAKMIKEEDVIGDDKACWESLTVKEDKHSIGHPTYNSCLLAMVLLNSITDDFMTTLLHSISHNLCNDETFVIWSLCHHINQNNVDFNETIRGKIMTATLAKHDNDVTKYVIYIKNKLKMITHASANTDNQKGLLRYIFCQLKLCSVALFQDYARRLLTKKANIQI